MDFPAADVVAGHAPHHVPLGHAQAELLPLAAAKFQGHVPNHADAVLLHVDCSGGLRGQAAINLRFFDLGPPAERKLAAAAQGRADGLAGLGRIVALPVGGPG